MIQGVSNDERTILMAEEGAVTPGGASRRATGHRDGAFIVTDPLDDPAARGGVLKPAGARSRVDYDG